MNTTYGHVFLKNIVKNKILMWAAALTTVLCFGFVITNHSIGVDDPLRNHYLFSHDSGSLIQQGRLLPLLFNALTGLVDFISFFNEFIAAALFLLSALLFAACSPFGLSNMAFRRAKPDSNRCSSAVLNMP